MSPELRTELSQVYHHPSAYAQMLIAFDFILGPAMEIVLAGTFNSPEIQEMLNEMDQRFFPNKILMLNTGEDEIISLAPFLKDKTLVAGKPALYLCQNYTCQKPIVSGQELAAILSKE